VGAEYVRNLKDQVVANPLPTVLIGAGLVWIMVGSWLGAPAASSKRSTYPQRDAARDTIGGNTFAAAADGAANAASDTTDSVDEKVGAAFDSVKQTVSSGYDKMTDGAHYAASSLSQSAKAAGQKGSELVEFCREQPLLLTGIGIAVGALIGALLPESAAEERIMGDTSKRMKEEARDLVSEQVNKVKEAGQRAMETPPTDGADRIDGAEAAAQDQQTTEEDRRQAMRGADRPPSGSDGAGPTPA
jgi:hypothetical protein